MSLKLFGNLLSQPSRALYIFLKQNNIPFEMCTIDMKNGEHLSEEYAKINPFKKVPAIEHNGVTFIESIAILRYICREFKIDDYWYPSSSINRAKVDEYLEWQHNNTRAFCGIYFQMKFLQPLITGKPASSDKILAAEKRMSDSLDLIENVWLKDKLFLIGNEITIADIIGACEVEQPRMSGYNPRNGRPRLAAWLDNVMAKTNPHYAEAHKFLNKIVNNHHEKGQNNRSML